MRKLGLKDAFALARIVKAANMRKEIVDFAAKVRGEGAKDMEAVGLEFFVTMVTAAADEAVERKIYEFYADIKGVEPGEIGGYDFETVKADIKELIGQNDLKSFFRSASALMSKQQSC